MPLTSTLRANDAMPTHPVATAPASPRTTPVSQTESTVIVRRTVYQQHLIAAQYFADAALAAEQRGIAGLDRVAERHHRDLVAASVLSSVAFLEVSVYALVLELQEGLTNGRRHSRRLHARLAREWRAHENAPMLQRYQLLLSLSDADTFHPRRPPFIQLHRLVRWRDALAHRTRGRLLRFAYDSLAPTPARTAGSTDATPRIGRLRLSAECAQWAVQSAITFSNDFCRRMNLPTRGLGEASR